jgi:hypothetical protein
MLAAYERPDAQQNRPVDEPRDNLWIPAHSLCRVCAQLVDKRWGILIHNRPELRIHNTHPVQKK